MEGAVESSSWGAATARRGQQRWGDEIWCGDHTPYTLAQLLWVKLADTTMRYAQLAFAGRVTSRRIEVCEVDLVMSADGGGVLLVGEVFGSPGEPTWRLAREYARLMHMRAALVHRLRDDELWRQCAPLLGWALVLRDVEAGMAPWLEHLPAELIITRDELPSIAHRLRQCFDFHLQTTTSWDRALSDALIEALRALGTSCGVFGSFVEPEQLYDRPRLPAWLR